MANFKVQEVLKNLNKNNFKAKYFSNVQEAKTAVLNEIAPNQSIGIGGSMTIYDMALHKELQDRGHKIYWHWLADPSERNEVRTKAADADVYLCSSNAVTVDGTLVNIDGIGNRVSSMFFGPKKVIIVCGINKITQDFEQAVDRIKTIVCPANAKRLKLNTPCAKTGKCHDCYTEERMCNITVKIERAPAGREIHIFLVDESLGF
ncbi:MAG: hypothetical protein PWP27_680 [Clostridiales bacterium]|jgi:hypothetical protein|nr:hypothetical protein [Clostridiales bacterium]MDK2932870.1 hypothetical protein [Clostridiales bacterium]